jgi:hypothetical protein
MHLGLGEVEVHAPRGGEITSRKGKEGKVT